MVQCQQKTCFQSFAAIANDTSLREGFGGAVYITTSITLRSNHMNRRVNFNPAGYWQRRQQSINMQYAHYSCSGSYPASSSRREFVIASEKSGKVLDIKGDSRSSGAQLIIYGQKSPPGRNQLWYLDNNNFIRSALNNYAIDAKSGHHATMEPFHGGPTQQWVLNGKKITNTVTNEVLDVFGDLIHDGARVGSYRYKGNSNQHWRITYV